MIKRSTVLYAPMHINIKQADMHTYSFKSNSRSSELDASIQAVWQARVFFISAAWYAYDMHMQLDECCNAAQCIVYIITYSKYIGSTHQKVSIRLADEKSWMLASERTGKLGIYSYHMAIMSTICICSDKSAETQRSLYNIYKHIRQKQGARQNIQSDSRVVKTVGC